MRSRTPSPHLQSLTPPPRAAGASLSTPPSQPSSRWSHTVRDPRSCTNYGQASNRRPRRRARAAKPGVGFSTDVTPSQEPTSPKTRHIYQFEHAPFGRFSARSRLAPSACQRASGLGALACQHASPFGSEACQPVVLEHCRARDTLPPLTAAPRTRQGGARAEKSQARGPQGLNVPTAWRREARSASLSYNCDRASLGAGLERKRSTGWKQYQVLVTA